ncbi:hypothetical protein CR513_51436, partial [Mucuna pruriens]
MQFQQNVIATIQDLKTQIGQLANIVSQLQSARSSNLPSQTIPNPRGNASVVTLRSGKELPQPTLQQLPRSAEADSEPNVDSRSRPKTAVPLPFPSSTILARKPESDEELLKIDPGIFSVPCTIGECTFADAMLDLGASINVMPASVYRSLNFGDLEPTRMTIELAN